MESKTRRVVQYDRSGNIIEVYPNAKSASIETGIGVSAISRCCNGLRKVSGGFVFAYEGTKDPLKDVNPPIEQYDLFGNLVDTFYDVAEISKKYPEYTAQAIRSCLAGKKDYYACSFWVYAGHKDEIPEKVEKYGRQVVAKSLDGDSSKDLYFGNIQLASEEMHLDRPLINRALKYNGLCDGYAWFRYSDKEGLKKFEDFKFEYFEFSKRRAVKVIAPEDKEEIYISVKSAAIHIGMPIHLVYCIANGQHLDLANGYKIEYIDPEK